MYSKVFHPSYSCAFTWFCLLRYIQKREFYFYFIAFCARVLLAVLDHNMHSFRPQATTKSGHLIFKKQYSNRTKNWHPEPFRAEKTHDYIQFLMASILAKGKSGWQGKCCKGYFSSIRSPNESGPNHWFVRKPRTDLVKDCRSRFGSKNEWGFSETSLLGADQRSGMFFLSLLKELATDIQSLEQFDLNLNQNYFIQYNYYYYKLLLFIGWCMLLLWNESHSGTHYNRHTYSY